MATLTPDSLPARAAGVYRGNPQPSGRVPADPAFGWEDSHLHRFTSGSSPYGPTASTTCARSRWGARRQLRQLIGDAETQAGLTYLILTAAPAPGDLDAAVAHFLADIGWATGDGTPMTALMASRAAWDTASLLRRRGAVTDGPAPRRDPLITAEGTALARAALRTWPGGPRSAVSVPDLARLAEAFTDLSDPDVMSRAWR
jgi:hypothetical protein